MQQPPPIIYHYTNDVGLKGILETGQLWLTDIFSLNDPSELTHGFSVAIDALTSKIAGDSVVAQKFAKNFAAFAEQGAVPKVAHFFMCSFSSQIIQQGATLRAIILDGPRPPRIPESKNGDTK